MAIKTEELRKAAETLGLKVGKTVTVERWSQQKNGSYICRRKDRGEVVGMYPYIFTVKIGNRSESFRYSQLFEAGGERVKV